MPPRVGELNFRGTTLSARTLGRAIRRLGWSRKKTLIAAERDLWERAAFAFQQTTLDANQLVVLDEFGSNLDIHPTQAWAPIAVAFSVRSDAPLPDTCD